MKKQIVVSLIGMLLLTGIPFLLKSQDLLQGGNISGSFQSDAQYLMDDKKMGISDNTLSGVRMRMNSFMNLVYTHGKFSTGLRFEAYLPPLPGFDARYEGAGVPYWFANYAGEKLEVTAGNFYEQFGSGLVLRAYQEWNLGFDNSIRGVRVAYRPMDGVTLKGIYGYQRYFWESLKDYDRGIVKGADLELDMNGMFKGLKDSKTKIILGGSVVSNFQKNKTLDLVSDTSIVELTLPRNVAAFAGRLSVSRGKFAFMTEYAGKINDPSARNNLIYKNGQALLASLSFSKKNLGIMVGMKRVDNMGFKSNRMEQGNPLDINFLPPVTKEHSYSLSAMYPYATQPNGEFGIEGQVVYTIPKKTPLGGKYGTTITLNYSRVNAIDKKAVNDTTALDEPGTLGYTSKFFSMGKDLYFQDFNIEVFRKFNKRWKATLSYVNLTYDKDVIEGHLNEYGKVYSNIGIAEVSWMVTEKTSLRLEAQGLFTKQDKGNWMAGTLELDVSPHWFFSVTDIYNYGNKDKNLQLHYYFGSLGYTYKSSRMFLSYGRQREGIVCVGGVCRYVTASSGLTLTITSTF